MARIDPPYVEKGTDGAITFDGEHVTIRHKWHSAHGKGEATYPLASITGVEIAAGRLRVVVPGVMRRYDGDGNVSDMTTISVPWGKGNRARFERLRNVLLAAIKEHQAGGAPAVTDRRPPGHGEDLLPLLERLAQLHDAGKLTDDEFVQAKARLLGG